MYIEYNNKQSIQSRELISKAMWLLLENDSLDEITVTQVCQEACVARKTFYRNFQYKADVIEYNLDIIFQSFSGRQRGNELQLDQLLLDTYEYARKFSKLFKLLQQKNLFHLVQTSYLRNLPGTLRMYKDESQQLPENELSLFNPYVLNFIASTFCSVLLMWVEQDYRESAEWLAAITKQFLMGLIQLNG